MDVPQHIQDFHKALTEEHRDLDFIKNNGFKFTKEELISISSELFYTMYQDAHDYCHDPRECDDIYASMIRQFISNMDEYESDFFRGHGGIVQKERVFNEESSDEFSTATLFSIAYDPCDPLNDAEEASYWGMSASVYRDILKKHNGNLVYHYKGQADLHLTDTYFLSREDAEAALKEVRAWEK